MLLLKVVCPSDLTDRVVDAINEIPGAGRISATASLDHDGSMTVLQTEIPNRSADQILAGLAALDGWGDGEVTLTEVGESERIRFDRGNAIAAAEREDGVGRRQVRTMLRHLVRFDYQYVALMMMAALIATVGLIANLPIAIIGAMAFSPDLGRLNAMAFALLIRDGGLFWHGTRSIAAGMVIAMALSALGTVILVLVGATDEPLSGIPAQLRDYVSVIDGFTIMIALAAGVAAMVVFIGERGQSAVGVGVSITTIPAAAYVGIALAAGEWTEAGSAAMVLIVNIVCVVGAEVATGFILRKRLRLRAEPTPRPGV